MTTTTPEPHHPENAFHGLDESVERVLGAAIVVLELAALGVVLYGFVGLLNKPENEDELL
jgi:hypothetical protein